MPRKRIPNFGGRGRSYEGAKELSEKFHGRGSRGERVVAKPIFFNRNLAELGPLEALEIIDDEDPDSCIELNFENDNLFLSCTPDAHQLIIAGTVEITPDEIPNVPEGEWKKHKVFLGECLAVSYFADKHHLAGPKSQKNGEHYRHEFGENTDIRPMAIYDRITKTLELVGGEYVVQDVGIVG